MEGVSEDMEISVQDLLSEFSGGELLLKGEVSHTHFFRISPLEDCGPGDLVFLPDPGKLDTIRARGPSIIVLPAKFREEVEKVPSKKESPILLFAGNLNLTMALIRQRYHDRVFDPEEWGEIHSSAVIHQSAELGKEVLVGPGAVIGRNCRIGKGSRILAGAILEEGVVLGEDCRIHSRVVLGYGSQLGNRVIVEAGTVLGSEGFGFAQDSSGVSHRIPQVGKVVLEDDVRIGANCCIDRATFRETRIRRGTKIDNLCHFAHNVDIGEDCLLTAGFTIAGSTKVGNRVIASGQTGVLDHLEIADDTILLHRAGVTESITETGVYAGLPLQPMKEYLKNTAIFRKLVDLRKQLQALEKRAEKEDRT